MQNLTKNEKRKFRRLAEVAYNREMTNALEALYEKFREWKENKIDAFELNEHIHKFHNGTSRELWKTFATNNSFDIIVKYAIANGILAKEEVEKVYKDDLEDIKLAREARNEYASNLHKGVEAGEFFKHRNKKHK